jgi:hypothetical protein
VPAIAEVLCQGCGAKRTAPIPVIARPWLVPLCECGARPQVVRVFSDRRREKVEVADDRRGSAASRLAARARVVPGSEPAPARGT